MNTKKNTKKYAGKLLILSFGFAALMCTHGANVSFAADSLLLFLPAGSSLTFTHDLALQPNATFAFFQNGQVDWDQTDPATLPVTRTLQYPITVPSVCGATETKTLTLPGPYCYFELNASPSSRVIPVGTVLLVKAASNDAESDPLRLGHSSGCNSIQLTETMSWVTIELANSASIKTINCAVPTVSPLPDGSSETPRMMTITEFAQQFEGVFTLKLGKPVPTNRFPSR